MPLSFPQVPQPGPKESEILCNSLYHSDEDWGRTYISEAEFEILTVQNTFTICWFISRYIPKVHR